MRPWFTSALTLALLAGRPALVSGPQEPREAPSASPAQDAPGGPADPVGGPLPHPGDLAGPGDVGRVLRAAPARSAPTAEARAALATRIDGILSGSRWGRSRFAVLAVDGETGDTVYARNAHEALAPASNLKVLTTAAALHHLGPDFRWMTWVTTEAPVVQGVVQGDLLVYGTGDPALGPGSRSEPGAFDELAAQLAARGIRRVEGRVVGDASYFEGPDRVDRWDPRDLNDWFAAAAPALGFNGNVVQLRVEAGPAGHFPTVHFDPPVGGVDVDMRALTVAGRPAARMHMLRDDPLEPIRVEGEIAATGRDVYRTMTVQDPVRFAAHAFVEALSEAGIEVTGGTGTIRDRAVSPLSSARVFTGSQHRVLARHRSAPLLDALAVVNLESHNLYADLVLKTLGRVVEGDGSFAGGARVVRRFLEDEIGVPAGVVEMYDGSGLAADDRASAAALVAALRHALSSPLGEALLQTLPEAGTRQMRRMTRTAAARNLRAKTGTIEGVSALSGVVRSADGRPLVFSILGNDLPSAWGAKRLEDEIGAALAAWSGSE